MLPLCSLFLVAIYLMAISSKSRLQKLILYINVLLLIYITIDIAGIAFKANVVPTNKFSINGRHQTTICDTCAKPDIYFLVFDEYESSSSLKTRYNYCNNLDTFLVNKGFNVQPQSTSNYNFTPFSIASILNMSYINGIKNTNAVTIEDYARCNALIENSEVMKFLENIGYETVNFSIFDMKGNPSLADESFLPVKTKLISDRTLASLINRDLTWQLILRFPFSHQ